MVSPVIREVRSYSSPDVAWGKLDAEKHHPLVHHCADVAAAFQALISQPVLAQRIEKAAGRTLDDVQASRLAAIVFLHDLGKVSPGFQAKGWPPGLWDRPTNGHLAEGWELLHLAQQKADHPLRDLLQSILQWGEGASALLAAAFAHHGRPVAWTGAASLARWPVLDHYDWRVESARIASALKAGFPVAFQPGGNPLPDRPVFQHLVAGLAALADWIGSDTRFFCYEPELRDDYVDLARERAVRAMRAIGLDVSRFADMPLPDFKTLTGFDAPNASQQTVNEVPLDARQVILEAETGSGKTEAALLHFSRLFASGKVAGLYFAVPTRAAARQLHRRIAGAMKRAFGSDGPASVLAIPGMLRADEQDGQKLPGWNVLWGDGRRQEHRFWAAEHATRFLAAPVAVGTVDQAMLGGLQVKHGHLRGSALSRSLLVVDEAHASDVYMTAILRPLLDAHLEAGGYSLLMSATLGSHVRAAWAGQTAPSYNAAVYTPYPAVWVGGEANPRAVQRTTLNKAVSMRAEATMDARRAAGIIVGAAKSGARVLVIRNTVKAAVDTWRAVQESGGEAPILHHSRYAAEDRVLLDKAAEAALHRAPEKRSGVRVVIGTQTLEQSLDIDADFLVTDLCPVDVLLQRIGRLHRHAGHRPEAFRTPACHVLMPEGGLDRLAQPAFENGLGAWIEGRSGSLAGIYTDLAVLELTARLVGEEPVWRIPAMNRQLVEAAIHPSRVEALMAGKGDKWRRYQQQHSGVQAARRMLADLRILDRTTPFGPDLRFPGSDERVMTRLGEEGPLILLNPAPAGPFGKPISRIALPAHWAIGLKDWDDPEIRVIQGGIELTLGGTTFRYTREGLTR